MKKDKIIKNIINTDADSSIKGIGLQKLRVVKRLLEALLNDNKVVFCAIEYVDDVIEIDMGEATSKITTEQNKNYSSPFSVNSPEIKNSLRIFFDTWRKVENDEKISFVFYTNTSICKENKVGEIKKLDLELPNEPILKLLIEKKYDEALPIIIPILKDYYIKQYRKHKGDDVQYYEEELADMKEEDWINFFDLIEWKFEEDDESGLTKKLELLVEELCSKFYVEIKYSKKILSCIKDLIESQSLNKNFLDKLVHVAQIEVLFKDFALEAKLEEKLDPVYKKWDEIEINDVRNLEKKILNVCEDFDKDELDELQDSYIEGKFEQTSYVEKREVKAYNYRIYKECKKRIKHILKDKEECKFSEVEIQEIIEILTDISEEHILDKSKTYKIPYKDRDMVKKTILILFEECFLALDKVGEKNG